MALADCDSDANPPPLAEPANAPAMIPDQANTRMDFVFMSAPL